MSEPPPALDVRVHLANTPAICDGPQSQPFTFWSVPWAICGPKARATASASMHPTWLPGKITTCSAPSGPRVCPHFSPEIVGASLWAGTEVAGGRFGPLTTGTLLFDAGVVTAGVDESDADDDDELLHPATTDITAAAPIVAVTRLRPTLRMADHGSRATATECESGLTDRREIVRAVSPDTASTSRDGKHNHAVC